MSPSPRLLMTLIVILSAMLGLTLIVLAWVVVQLRRQPVTALARAVDDLRTRQDALEAMMDESRAVQGGRARAPKLIRAPRCDDPVRGPVVSTRPSQPPSQVRP